MKFVKKIVLNVQLCGNGKIHINNELPECIQAKYLLDSCATKTHGDNTKFILPFHRTDIGKNFLRLSRNQNFEHMHSWKLENPS